MKNVPQKVYLTLGEISEDAEDFKDLEDVSWCSNKVYEYDIEYVISGQNTDDLHSASVDYAVSQGVIDHDKRQPFQNAFKAGWQQSQTQQSAKDKEKDELLREFVQVLYLFDSAADVSASGGTENALEKVSIMIQEAITRYNSLTSPNTITESK